MEENLLDATEAPSSWDRETLDVRDLPPPEPLRETLEALMTLDDQTVLVQYNDRIPKHLFPKLSERGFQYESVETDGAVLTAIWPD